MKRILSLSLFLLLLLGSLACPALASESVVATGGDSYVRSGPGLSYSAIGLLYEGDFLPYTGSTTWDSRGVAWYSVSYGSYGSAWVSSKYTSLSGNGGSFDEDYFGLCVQATAQCNVRTGPGLDYDKMGLLFEGDRVEYLGTSSTDSRGVTWYKVRFYSYGTGWTSSKYSELVTGAPGATDGGSVSSSGSYIEATGDLNVRSGPGLGYSYIGIIREGNTATYLGSSSVDERGVTWYEIAYKSGSGWVSSRYCILKGSSDWWFN